MSGNKNYYNIIGLTPQEKQLHGEDFTKVLKSKFRQASLKYHPDRLVNKSDKEKKEAEEKFKEIAEAYEILNDPQKRQQYDTFGTIDDSGFSFRHGTFHDIFQQFFGNTDWGFATNMRAEPTYKGSDKTIRINLTLRELYCEKEKTIKYRKFVPCSHCGGSGSNSGVEQECPYCYGRGQITETRRSAFGIVSTTTTCSHCQGMGVVLRDPCAYCHGQGIVEQEVERTFPVPTIDKFGNLSIERGEGNACFRGKGDNGDLHYSYRVVATDDDEFRVEDMNAYNLITDIDVPILDCLLGGETEFTHIDGKKLKININPLTEEGMVYTIKDYGLPYRNGQRGSLKVTIHILLPLSLTEEDKEILNNLRQSPSFK